MRNPTLVRHPNVVVSPGMREDERWPGPLATEDGSLAKAAAEALVLGGALGLAFYVLASVALLA